MVDRHRVQAEAADVRPEDVERAGHGLDGVDAARPADDFGQVPWPNNSALISPERTEPLTDDRAIRCAWDARGVDVLIDGTRWARLEHGACPGWSRLAVKDGPLARRLAAYSICST